MSLSSLENVIVLKQVLHNFNKTRVHVDIVVRWFDSTTLVGVPVWILFFINVSHKDMILTDILTQSTLLDTLLYC